jgi:exopolysaccharide biosynthesis polyprenyl glycosylphosphotransferase
MDSRPHQATVGRQDGSSARADDGRLRPEDDAAWFFGDDERARPAVPAALTEGFAWTVPQQRPPRPAPAPPAEQPAEQEPAEPDLRSTVVLPYLGSPSAVRTRSLRAWMLTLPIDLVALLTPLLWDRQFWKAVVVTALLAVALFASGGLYRARRHISFLDELPSLYGRLLAASAVVGIITAERHDSFNYVGGFLRAVALSGLMLLVGRAVTRKAVLVARRRRWVEHSAIILGGGPIATELARLLRRYPEYGLRFTGFVDVAGSVHDDKEAKPLIGHLGNLDEMIRLSRCDVVIVADIDCAETELMEIAERPAVAACDLWVVPRLLDFPANAGIPDHIGAIPVVRARRLDLTGPKWAVKRASDILFAAVALIVLSPVMALCALASFIDGGKGIFFRQQRIGRHGKPFELIKFRSMRPRDEKDSQTTWSVAHDPRVGPIGRFLRRSSLDELPQLWNILRGDMSVVGPRPERPFFVDQFSADYPDYAMRHRVAVGLTGLAQVSGLRGDTPISDRARFDNYYIENWSLWLDVKVLLRTVAEVFRGGGR